MRLVALVSGGKDSTYNMLQCIAAGHEIVALANIEPNGKDELDSYMYQSVGHEAVSLLSGALALPLYRIKTNGEAKCKDKTYSETNHDEVEDLYKLLSNVYNEVQIDGVSVGAVLSDYQRTRVENVCSRLNLKCFAYLWHRDQSELLNEMIEVGINAVLIKIAAMGLDPQKHLGKSIAELAQYLHELNKMYGVSVVGEGGEYETFTLDCPLFHRSVSLNECETVIHSNDAFAPVAYMRVNGAFLLTKSWGNIEPMNTITKRLQAVTERVHDPMYYVQDVCVQNSVNDSKQDSGETKSDWDILHLPENMENEGSVHSLPAKKQAHAGSGKVHEKPEMTNFQVNPNTGWCWIGNISGATTTAAFKNVRKYLECLQYTTNNIVSVTLFLKTMSEFNDINTLYTELIASDTEPPVRACVATTLPNDAAVLMYVVAHRTVSNLKTLTQQVDSRDVMYVRSISHWAPANIGPYSQCVTVCIRSYTG